MGKPNPDCKACGGTGRVGDDIGWEDDILTYVHINADKCHCTLDAPEQCVWCSTLYEKKDSDASKPGAFCSKGHQRLYEDEISGGDLEFL
jgi:hypothetical protein